MDTPGNVRIKGRALKKKVMEILTGGEGDPANRLLERFSPRQVINPLFALILSADPHIKWAAVTALGQAVASIAREDMESARVVVRRFMWQLNDESGGIGWGCPEAMAEALAQEGSLAREYARVLVSYIREDGNFLEYEPLQRGAVWGVARLADVRPHLVRHAVPHLLPLLRSDDALVRGHALWALGLLGAQEAKGAVKGLLDDGTRVKMYRNGALEKVTLSELASEALDRIETSAPETGPSQSSGT